MTSVIGTQSSIALEYGIANPGTMTGYARFWFGNACVGSLEERVYLDGYVMGCLQDLQRKPPLCRRYAHLQGVALFQALDADLSGGDGHPAEDSSDNARAYVLQCGTLFDIYTVFAYRDDADAYHVLWRLRIAPEDLPYGDLTTVAQAIHCARFGAGQLATVIAQFAQAIETARAGSRTQPAVAAAPDAGIA